MKSPLLENLESRKLFAGVTLLTHGWNGTLGGWLSRAADGITARLGGNSQVPRYVLKVAPAQNTGVLKAQSITHVDGTARPQDGKYSEIILELDYTAISTDPGYSLGNIADVTADFMMNHPVDGIRLAELPLHEISLSRGTGLLDEIAKSLGKSGVWVDQETYLDPFPISEMGDGPMVIYDNVAFVDDYWRTDGDPNNGDKDGFPVDGAYNLNAQWLQDEHGGYELAHLAPSGYYVGTIALDRTSSGEGPIYSDWYGNGKPDRDKTGFYYSAIVGGPRPSSGVWSASGGSGTRTPTGQDGAQWPNIADLSLTSSSSVAGGQPISVKYIHQDRDGATTATFYLDSDQNPYNDFSRTLGQKTLTEGGAISSDTFSASSAGASAGSYYIVAKIEDADGHARYAYSGTKVDITSSAPPPPIDARVDSNHNLRVNGTSGNDLIRISQSPSKPDRLVVNINGVSAAWVMSDVQSIYVFGGDGNDVLSIFERYGTITNPARMMGGNGNDTLVGGSGNDLLFGEDGNDKIYGAAGRDRIDGGLGTDRLYGQGGSDWFVNPKTVELLDFGGSDSILA